MLKFAVIGTSCSGKTTLVYNVVGKLRKEGIHIEGLTSSDRIYPFKQEKLDYLDSAQAYVIIQQAFLELRSEVRDDIEIILSDRSLLDFFAYYIYCFKDSQHPYFQGLIGLIGHWMESYEEVYYVEPLPWVDDHKRPNDEFRLGVDEVLKSLISKFPNIVYVKEDNREDFVSSRILEKWKASKV